MYEEFTKLTLDEAGRYCTAPIETMKSHDQRIIRLMVDSVRKSCGTVLDVGCGTGRLAGEFGSDNYIGIDVSPVLVGVAIERHPNHTFVVMDAGNMEFGDDSFDNSVCGGVLPHMPTEDIAIKIIREMVRVTKRLLQITWSTIPGPETQIRRVTGHFGKPTYQNMYRRTEIMKAIPKSAKLVEDTFNGCALWRVYL